MMRSKITRILSYKHQKHQKNYSTFRQFSNYTHYSALFRGAKLRNSGTPKGQVTVLIYDNTLLLFRIRTCPLSPSSGVLPLTLLNLGCTRHSSSELGSALICTRFQAAFVVCFLYRGRCPRLLFSSAFQAPECLRGTGDVITFQAPERLRCPLRGRKNPEDRGGADTQVALVGRRTCGIPIDPG